MGDEITDAELVTAALGPRKSKNEHGEIEERSVEELIAARDAIYRVAQRDSNRSAWAGLRPARVILPGGR